jgi:dihydrofolate reductase
VHVSSWPLKFPRYVPEIGVTAYGSLATADPAEIAATAAATQHERAHLGVTADRGCRITCSSFAAILPHVVAEVTLAAMSFRHPERRIERPERRKAMGKLVVTEFISIDGVFEDPGGAEDYEHGGWTFEYDRGDEGNTFKLDELTEAEVQLLGRVTYEGFAAAWPSREGPFADKLNSDRKYVVSRSLVDPEWQNTTVLSGDVVDDVKKLKEDVDGVILVAGSGTLVHTLLEADLVDELRLMVFPTILGRGRRLFPDGIDRLKLTLAESRTVGPDGVQITVYRRY